MTEDLARRVYAIFVEGVSMRTRISIATVLTLAVAAPVAPVHAKGDPGSGTGGYESEQGTRLFRTLDPDLESLHIDYRGAAIKRGDRQMSYTKLSIQSGQISGTLDDGSAIAGAAVVGTRLRSRLPGATGGERWLVIEAARPHRNIYNGQPSSYVWEYQVTVEAGKGRSPLCTKEPETNLALVVPGAWDASKALSDPAGDNRFMFSCVPMVVSDSTPEPLLPLITRPVHLSAAERLAAELPTDELERRLVGGGAAAKCIDYGYAPWATGVPALGGTTRWGKQLPPADDAAARRFHNLCTRVFTADYGADGHSHTIPGTLIRIFDLSNLPVDRCTQTTPGVEPACTEVKPGEGAAGSAGSAGGSGRFQLGSAARLKESLAKLHVAMVARPKVRGNLHYEGAWVVDRSGVARALCLSKARWHSIDATDPQLSKAHLDPGDGSWSYCEDGTLVTFADYDTVLVSYSGINERALYRLKLDAHRWVTTTRVHATEHGLELVGSKEFPQSCKAPCKSLRFEGAVLSAAVPGESDSLHAVPLVLYRNPAGDYLTVTRDDKNPTKIPAGYQRVDDQIEGYLFRRPPPLPDPDEPLHTGASVSKVWLRKDGASYLTAATKEPGYKRIERLGFLLLPDTVLRLRIQEATARPQYDPDPELGQIQIDKQPIERATP
jgi:ADYC domain-containing protein